MSAFSFGEQTQRSQAFHNILLIEDDEATSEMLTECIESQSSYRVRSFSSGEDVLQHLQESKQVIPHLFIIDFLLPGMTGLQLLEHLHSLEPLEQVPVIMISAATVTEDIKAALQNRSVTLLSKPFELPNLLDHLELVLSDSPRQLL